MMPEVVLVALAAVGLSMAVCGLFLSMARVTPSGPGLIVGAALLMSASVLDASGYGDAARFFLTLAGLLVIPLALTTYPLSRWRQVVHVSGLVTVAGIGLFALARWENVNVVGTAGLVVGLVLIAHTWWRIETSRGPERSALMWMALGLAVPALIAGAAEFTVQSTAGSVVGVGAFVVTAPAMYLGVAKPDIVDVRGLVVHSVVFAFAAITYVSAFMLLESLLEVLTDDVPIAGTMAVLGLLVATTFHPLQVILRGVVDRLLFGLRPDPLDAATSVISRIGDDPVLALRAIRQALVVPYAALRVGDQIAATSGTPVTHTRAFPLELGEEHGELLVGLRAGDLKLNAGDEHALRLVVPLLAQTMRAHRLAADLQVSRGATISALEEERRRLRRDLHDGLGPRLSGIAFTTDAARNKLRTDPDAAEELLITLRAETVNAIEEIRELVYAMRPPALDELGLVPALRQQAMMLRSPAGQPLTVAITADSVPDTISAATEVAAYRIVVEALTNVARHSGSDTADVSMRVGDAGLSIEVSDAGPHAGTWTAGVGITSMRERAAELGGSLTIDIGQHRSNVRAVLPLD